MLRQCIQQLRESVDLAKGSPKENPLGSLNLDDKIAHLAKVLKKRINKDRVSRPVTTDPSTNSTQPGAPPLVP